VFDRQQQWWARSVKRDAVAVWIAARDPRVPSSAKVVAAATAASALSPIDLIPDFIPVIVVGALFIVIVWCAAIGLIGLWLHRHGFLRWPSFLLSKSS
jgi:uncharacterized membrane protein YkvA (DUF1232 family)